MSLVLDVHSLPKPVNPGEKNPTHEPITHKRPRKSDGCERGKRESSSKKVKRYLSQRGINVLRLGTNESILTAVVKTPISRLNSIAKAFNGSYMNASG